jgi:hypothetical protein
MHRCHAEFERSPQDEHQEFLEKLICSRQSSKYGGGQDLATARSLFFTSVFQTARG